MATAAPAAPPPAPAKSAPAPAASPAAPPAAPASDNAAEWASEQFAELDALDAGQSDAPNPAAKPADKPPGDVKPPEGAKPGDKPPGDAPPAEPPTPVKAKELREAYEALKKETRETLRPALQKAEARIKELESAKPQDLTPLQEKLAATEKRNAELESHIQFVDYEKSTEFKTKYQQPYLEAWQRAIGDFSQLTVRVPTGENDADGNPTFASRRATDKDLLSLANMPLSEMDAAAEEMFGRSAARVIRHVEKIRELSEAQDKALTDARTNADKRAETQKLQSTAQVQAKQKLWKESNEQLAAKYPDWFAPVEGDTEGNALLEKGFALADRMFAPTPETAPKTPEETVRLHAVLRNRIANHDRLALGRKRDKARIKELEASLAEYEKSDPNGGLRGGGGGGGGTADPIAEAEAEIDKLDVN